MGDTAASKEPRRGAALGTAEIVVAMTLAGSSVVVGKILSTRMPVFLAAELSLIAALVAILPLQLARLRELTLLGRRELASMFLQALCGIVVFRVLTLYGLHFTTAAQAGLVTSAAPAVMAILARLILKERPGKRGILGVALTLAGLVAVNIHGAIAAPTSGFLLGNVLVLGATVCEALLTIFRKSSGGRIGSITNTTVLVAMSAAMLLPFALLDLRGFSPAGVGAAGWLSVAYYGAVATVIAYILWGDGALRIPAHRTGIATAAMPVSALLLSALVLREPLGVVSVAGCAAVVVGIVVAGRQPVAARVDIGGRSV
jgi:drug/metabolite transporter (DMT)-like permease